MSATSDLHFSLSQRGYPEVTLMDCMRLFTKEDVLDGDEKPVSHPPWQRECISLSPLGGGPA